MRALRQDICFSGSLKPVLIGDSCLHGSALIVPCADCDMDINFLKENA